MAGLILAGVGALVGGEIGGTILGISMAVVGQTIGSVVGSIIDSYLFAPNFHSKQKGPRLQEAQVFTSTEGSPISRAYGRFKLPGNLIWASRFREEVIRDVTTQGGKGGGGGTTTTTTITYEYYANFAVGLCEGVIANIHRVWVDGKLLDLSKVTYRVYTGTESQTADSLMTTKDGAGNVPAYRGLAYVVFEDMQINEFGNRIPQFSFEITKPINSGSYVGDLLTGINVIPGDTEFGYDPDVVERVIVTAPLDDPPTELPKWNQGNLNFNFPISGKNTEEKGVHAENNRSIPDVSDWELAMDQLEGSLVNCNIVTLAITWFGDDLRIGSCTIKPKVESLSKITKPYSWVVAETDREDADLLSEFDGSPSFGGTPNDLSIYKAISDLQTRGFEVMIYPMIQMDIASGNTLNDPYSNSAATVGQPIYPKRNLITCSPAIGYTGAVDQSATAKTQIDTFLGTAEASEFSGSGGAPVYSGTAEWTYNRFILHLAELCRQAGGVEYFVLGGQMVAATNHRDDLDDFPFVDGLVALAAEVATLLPSAQLSYAANWNEYHSYRPAADTDEVWFNLDSLWGDSNIDFIGIDNFMPVSDWRNGTSHSDYGTGNDTYNNPKTSLIYDTDYLEGQMNGGEFYDYTYVSVADRLAQTRTAIADTRHSEAWVFGDKQIKSWWQNAHHSRPAGIRDSLANLGPTPSTYQLVSGATMTPAGESALFDFGAPQDLESAGTVNDRARVHTANNIDNTGGKRFVLRAWVQDGDSDACRLMVAYSGDNCLSVFTFSTESFSETPGGHTINSSSFTDLGSGVYELVLDVTLLSVDITPNFEIGHNSAVVGEYIIVFGAEVHEYGVSSTDWVIESKPIIFTQYGCPSVNKGTNQPDQTLDYKSSGSALPRFSSGARDDEIQRQYLRAMSQFYGDSSNNPTAVLDESLQMVDTTRMCCWAYDARPWPTFPADSDTWKDQPNWQYGHWVSGRLDTVYMPDLLASLAVDYNVTAAYDFSEAYGTCDGFIVQSKTSFRSTVEPLATLFQFDVIESAGSFKAVSSQDVRSVATLELDDLAEAAKDSEVVVLGRQQETELPREISLRYIDVLKDYEPASVHQSREVVEALGSPDTDIPIVIDMARAQQLVDRLLYSAWARRTTAEFGMLPEFISLESGDVVTVNALGFNRDFRIDTLSDGSFRSATAKSFDQGIAEIAGTPDRTHSLVTQPVASGIVMAFMDLPRLSSRDVAWAPYTAAYTHPWPNVVIRKSITTSDYTRDSVLKSPAIMGETVSEFNSGEPDIWDKANDLVVKIYSESLSSRQELAVLSGRNTLAIETSSGNWEIVQFVTATLTGTDEYTLTQLLRGQLGTEDNIVATLAAPARVVFLDFSIGQLDWGWNDAEIEYNIQYGPANRDIGHATFRTVQRTFYQRGMMPFSPVHVTAVASGGDSVISWIRRNRIAGDKWGRVEIPQSEKTEDYEVDIMASVGSDTAVRTLTVTDATTVTYTSAQKSTDSISAPFDVMIYQIGVHPGRGIGRRKTITV